MPNFASSQVQIIPILLHYGLHTGPYHSTEIHQRNPFLVSLNIFGPFSATASLDVAFRCSQLPLLYNATLRLCAQSGYLSTFILKLFAQKLDLGDHD